MIDYNGKQYETRELYLDKQRGSVTIAKMDLNKALGNMKGKEAKAVDEQIAYYADEEEWELPSKELKEAIYGPTKKQQ